MSAYILRHIILSGCQYRLSLSNLRECELKYTRKYQKKKSSWKGRRKMRWERVKVKLKEAGAQAAGYGEINRSGKIACILWTNISIILLNKSLLWNSDLENEREQNRRPSRWKISPRTRSRQTARYIFIMSADELDNNPIRTQSSIKASSNRITSSN